MAEVVDPNDFVANNQYLIIDHYYWKELYSDDYHEVHREIVATYIDKEAVRGDIPTCPSYWLNFNVSTRDAQYMNPHDYYPDSDDSDFDAESDDKQWVAILCRCEYMDGAANAETKYQTYKGDRKIRIYELTATPVLKGGTKRSRRRRKCKRGSRRRRHRR